MGLYLLSLVLPAVVVGGKDLLGETADPQTLYGFQCLVIGFVMLPGWLANPLLLIGAPLLVVGARGAAIALFSLALASALIAPFVMMSVDLGRLDHLHVGYFVWLASIVTLLIAALTAPVAPRASWPSRSLPR